MVCNLANVGVDVKHFGFAIAVGLFCSSAGAQDKDPKPDFRPYMGEDNVSGTFAGSDGELLLKYLLEPQQKAQKREFETTAAHKARTANLFEILSPVDPTHFYALPIKGVIAKYDADREVWNLSTSFGDGCASFPERTTLLSCSSSTKRVTRSSYLAQNAFGATATVEDVTYTDIKFVVSDKWPRVQDIFPNGPIGGRMLKLSINMPIDEARKLADKELTVYAIGTMVSEEVGKEDPKYFAPTVSDPTRTRISSYILPLLAQQLIVVAEGEARPIAIISLSGMPLVVP